MNLLRVAYMVAALVLSIAGVAGAPDASALTIDERLEDPVLEQRAREISKNIRCLVCQNQSIEDSEAELAKDLRVVVRERVLAGDSNQQVEEFLTARYGDWVLLQPPFNKMTLALWVGPAVVLLLGGLAGWRMFRSNRTGRTGPPVGDGLADFQQPTATTALSDSEKSQLEKLLADEQPTDREQQ